MGYLKNTWTSALRSASPLTKWLEYHYKRFKRRTEGRLKKLERKLGIRLPFRTLSNLFAIAIAISMMFFVTGDDGKLRSIPKNVLAHVSQYLVEAKISDDAEPVFLGKVNPEWKTLSIDTQKEEARRISDWLSQNNVQIGYLSSDQFAVAQFIGGKVVLSSSHGPGP